MVGSFNKSKEGSGTEVDELIQLVEKNITSLKSSIEYNKKYFDYPFTNNCEHYYKLMLLHNRLENWEQFLSALLYFKNTRCKEVSKKSAYFEKVMKIECEGVLGFITKQTQSNVLEYMKHLEWKLEELEGIWLNGNR
ncbi:MAG: hypothetical protein K0S39_2052 [Paenibacillus sp.]|jgi:hypothetical protein|nr:hypothetical protein [Paenibacillus sp.]